MDRIKSAEYVYNQNGGIAHCIVTYISGRVESVPGTDQARLTEVQAILKEQQKQILLG